MESILECIIADSDVQITCANDIDLVELRLLFQKRHETNSDQEESVAPVLKLVENIWINLKKNNHYDNREIVLKICFGIFFDVESDSPIRLFLSKSFKNLAKDVPGTNLSQLFLVLIQSKIIEGFFEHAINCDPEKIIQNIPIYSNVFTGLRTIIQELIHQDIDLDLLLRLLHCLFKMHEKTQCCLDNLVKHNDVSEPCSESNLYAKFVQHFELEFKLINVILSRISNHNLDDLSVKDKDIMIKFFDNLSSMLSHQSSLPVSIIIEGSHLMIRLSYLLEHQCWTKVLHQTLSDYIEEQYSYSSQSPKLLTALLSVFLMDSPKIPQIVLSPKLSYLVGKVVQSWNNFTESEFVYHVAFLYFNWTKSLNQALKEVIESETEMDHIHKDILKMIEFVKTYWSHGNIEYIFKVASNCIQILKRITKNEMDFRKYLTDQLYPDFCNSEDPVSVFRLFCIISDSIGSQTFKLIFQDLLIDEYPLGHSLSLFLANFGANNLIEAFDQTEDEVDSDMKIVPFNIQNTGHRNMDFVLFISLRFDLMYPDLTAKAFAEFEGVLKNRCPRQSLFFLKYILPKLLNVPNSNCKIIINQMMQKVLNDIGLIYELPVELSLSILKLNRQENWLNPKEERRLIEEYIRRIVRFGRQEDEDVLVETLALLIENRKNTEQLTESEMESIFDLFTQCDSFQQAYLRDQLVTLFKKLLLRIGNSLKYIRNDFKKCQSYENFLQGIFQFCLDNLRPNKYFGSILVCLQYLDLCLKLYSSNDGFPEVKFLLKIDYNIEPKDLQSLMLMLQHSFEEIRNLTKQIIVKCYKLNLVNFTGSELDNFSKCSEQMLQLVQPRAVHTGVILAQLVISLRNVKDDSYQIHYDVIRKLNNDLKTRIDMPDQKKPIYPVLSAIKSILCLEIKMESLIKSFQNDSNNQLSQWRTLFLNLLETCIAACRSVSMIVCSDSPEGYLPQHMDDTGTATMMDQVERQQKESQILLFNGWMTIQESVIILSNLIGTLANHNQWRLVDCQPIAKVVDFIYENQLNLVHRGAFEQSSYAFNRLVVAIRKNDCKNCHLKIQQIIDEIQERLLNKSSVQSDDGDSNKNRYVSITRRSAGLPFVVQSILAVEPVKSRNHSGHFHSFASKLIEILDPNSANRRYPWQIIHSLNIFKVMVRDARLAPQINIWIENLITLTLSWFNKNTQQQCLHITDVQYVYCIQNSCSMLLSALMNRIFGSKRNRADTSRKNRMSSQLFFQSYPSLYSFFVKQLETNIQTRQTQLSICATLIILSKLIISSNDKSIFDARRFLPLIQKLIYQSRDARVRQLSVQTYVSLLSWFDYEKMFEELEQNMTCIPEVDKQNHFHGLGLLLAEITFQYWQHMVFDAPIPSLKMKTKPNNSILILLLKLYSNLNKFFQSDHYNQIEDIALRTFHQAHFRILSMISLKNREEAFQVYGDSIEILKKLIVSKTETESNKIKLLEDGYCLDLIIDYILHSSINDNGQELASAINQIAAMKQNHFLEAKLAFWCLINEWFLIDCSGLSGDLPKLSYSNLETIFLNSIKESIFLLKYFYKLGMIRVAHFWNKDSLSNLMNESVEIKKLSIQIKSKKKKTLLNIESEILGQIFNFMFLARKSKIIEDINPFLEGLGLDLDSLLDFFNQVNPDDNFGHSLVLVIQQCVEDKLSKNDLNLSTWSNLVKILANLSSNIENVHARLTSIYCVHGLIQKLKETLPKFFDIQDQNSWSELMTRIFIILLNLLQDNEKIVRKTCAAKILSLDHSANGTISPVESPQMLCIQIYVGFLSKRIGSPESSIPILFETILYFFDQSIFYDYDFDGIESDFLDTSKFNIFIDEFSIIMDMMEQLSALLRITEYSGETNLERLKNVLAKQPENDRLRLMDRLEAIERLSLEAYDPFLQGYKLKYQQFLDLLELKF